MHGRLQYHYHSPNARLSVCFETNTHVQFFIYIQLQRDSPSSYEAEVSLQSRTNKVVSSGQCTPDNVGDIKIDETGAALHIQFANLFDKIIRPMMFSSCDSRYSFCIIKSFYGIARILWDKSTIARVFYSDMMKKYMYPL